MEVILNKRRPEGVLFHNPLMKVSSPLAVGILEQLFYTPTISLSRIAEQFNLDTLAEGTKI